MRTFKQIQDDVLDQLKEDRADPNYWTIDEIKNAINETYVDIADDFNCFRLDKIIEVKANISTYKMPYDYIMGSLYRVEFNNELIYPITSHEMDSISSTWRTVSGTPVNYLSPGDLCNTDEIILYPAPDTDGAVYNLASTSEDRGVITAVEDDSFEEFTQEEGVIVDTNDNARFDSLHGTGPVLDIEDPTDNLRVFGARYPKRLVNDNEVFLHPVSFNPKRIITLGSLAILYAKEGEGKDIAKASFYNKRFIQFAKKALGKSKSRRFHVMKSISEVSIGRGGVDGRLNVGDRYPTYYKRY